MCNRLSGKERQNSLTEQPKKEAIVTWVDIARRSSQAAGNDCYRCCEQVEETLAAYLQRSTMILNINHVICRTMSLTLFLKGGTLRTAVIIFDQ